jgi:hypothetical protein
MPADTATSERSRQSTRWTRPLQLVVAISSVIFTIGTTLQNFVVVNLSLMEDTMQLAGQTPAEAADNAPGFLLGFRIVGCIYIVGNALGILAWRGYPWVFWVALVVNITQAAGVVAIPPEFWEAARDRYGIAGLLPSIVTDGGAVVVAVAMLASLLAYRTTWAHRRVEPAGA